MSEIRPGGSLSEWEEYLFDSESCHTDVAIKAVCATNHVIFNVAVSDSRYCKMGEMGGKKNGALQLSSMWRSAVSLYF